MANFFLDSSAIIDYLDGNKKGAEVAKTIANSECTTNILCYCEVLNYFDLKTRAKAEEFFSRLSNYQITTADGRTTKEIIYDCIKQGKQVSSMDAIAAATAINRNLTLIATDKDFERIQGLKKQIF